MTDDGTQILKAIQQIRELHKSVSLLLNTVDKPMAERGWKNAKNDSTALHDMSYSIDSPDRWMPREVFRYYKHADHPSILASIAVLLDDLDNRLHEPLISAVLFDLGEGRTVGTFYNWLATIYKAIPGREPDGQIFKISRPQLEQSWQSDFEKVWCFAYPLVEIKSETDLRNKVVAKLLTQVGGVS